MPNDLTLILQRLEQNKLWDFPGGVHPDGRKTLSNQTNIATLPIPQRLIIPVRQHIGTAGSCLVNIDDFVLKGQALTHSPHPFSVPVHAPTSGQVIAIEARATAHPSGLNELSIVISPDGKDQWAPLTPFADYTQATPNELLSAICDAGISGMGGAGFPTHIKTSPSKPIEFLIINGVECEPYITSDDRLMREHAWQIRQGIDILMHIIAPKVVIVAIEDNKPQALQALTKACENASSVRVVSVPTKYPAGGEKQLVQVLTGREVPRDGLPADIAVTMFNVGTCYAIADAILHGKPLIQRVVTLTGEALQAPQNVWALIGTPVDYLLAQGRYQPNRQPKPTVIMGGPMMGFTLPTVDVPVVKTTNCILVPAKKELRIGQRELACIRCSACADACPASLLPQQLYWHSKAGELEKAQAYNLFDCIECGACAYVCPSEIPLVHYYRKAKAQIRVQKDEKDKAEKSRQRFEARKMRLEREKEEREAKHRQAAEARKLANANQPASMSGNAESNPTAKDKVAAALARAKAKKAAQQSADVAANSEETEQTQTTTVTKSDKVAAAIARAKAKKANQQNSSSVSAASQPYESTNDKPVESTDNSDRKAKVAAAIARAKAKKAQAEQASIDNAQQNSTVQSDDAVIASNTLPTSQAENASDLTPEARRKAKIAAAVAKAKAKKSLTPPPSSTAANQDSTSGDLSPEAKRKAKIAEAVARAKAKKAERQSTNGKQDSQ